MRVAVFVVVVIIVCVCVCARARSCVCFSTNVDNHNVYANRAGFQVFLHHHSLHLLDSVEKNPITLIFTKYQVSFFFFFLRVYVSMYRCALVFCV